MPARWISLDGACNVRDLGGLPAGSGRWIQPCRLIRSDNLQDLTTRDAAVLVEGIGVRSVIDLRGTGQCPNGCRAAPYRRYLRRADSILAALRVIAEPDGAPIVHCAVGKDRTGLVVALALTLLEVPEDLDVADYLHSAERAETVEDRLAGTGLHTAGRGPGRDTPVRATMESFLAGLRHDHGGVRRWLAGRGWTDRDTSRLALSLTDPLR